MHAAIFDYVIVGSGPAGCVLAKRLSEQPGVTICVLEAGGSDRNLFLRIPAGYTRTLYGSRYIWPFLTVPNLASANRSIAVPQGRVVGGSSSINGLVHSRGQRQDFHSWAGAGGNWSYADVLPYFRRCEAYLSPGDPQFRGFAGELPVSQPDWRDPLCEAFIAAAEEHGIPRNPDYNGESQEGAGYFQRYIARGWRVSAARAFLYPAMRIGRIDLRMHAEVTGLILEGRKAVGARYRRSDGASEAVFARRGVILSAGTLNSPKILQLSGIGPGGLLNRNGIPVVSALEGVGENLQDHYTVRVSARARNVRTINERARGWRLAVEIARWTVGLSSILALSPSLVHVFWKSRPGLPNGDLQVLFTPGSYKPGRVYVLDDHPGMTCGARQQRPESRGHVRIASADPHQAPLIQPNYLTKEKDQEVLLAGLKLARRLLRGRAMARYFEAETVPGPEAQSEDELLDFARRTGNTGYHLVGTCRMGPADDASAVVDGELKVHGLEGLRVVDASVMPAVPSANTQAATLMIAEKAADMILGRPPLPRAELEDIEGGKEPKLEPEPLDQEQQ